MHSLRPVLAIIRKKQTKRKGIIAQEMRKKRKHKKDDTQRQAGRDRKKSYIMYIMLRPVNLSVSVCVGAERALS